MVDLTVEAYKKLAEPLMTIEAVAQAEEISNAIFEDEKMPLRDAETMFKYGMVFGRAVALAGIWDSMAEKAAFSNAQKERGNATAQ